MNDATNDADLAAGEDDDRAIRNLLANQPAPGSMPNAISARIEAALLLEQQTRFSGAPTGRLSLASADYTHPSRDSADARAAPLGSSAQPSFAPVVQLDSRRRGRSLRALGVAAAVAAVVVGGGALGVAAFNQQNVPVAAAPIDVGALASRVTVSSTGQDYSAGGLPTQAATLLASPASMQVSPDVAQQYGAMATSKGILNCVSSLGTALAANPDRITVDLATYKGLPAVVIVLTAGAKSTAWVVGRNCSEASAPLAGPTAVAT